MPEIDTARTTEAIRRLSAESSRPEAIAEVIGSPQLFAPPVFYLLSHALLAEGRPQEAMFWFYAGQLRARFDANRCADFTARQAVSVLNDRFGEPINRYAFAHLEELAEVVPRVLAWDRATPHDYDHRWINLHGMAAMQTTLDPGVPHTPQSLPAESWESLAEQTREEYWAGFCEALAAARRQAPGAD
ncbi:hypothetical protein HJ590_00805 [Naumannella sp. ID2617S]|nr:hypothetical protein [Naumannella sp. ID2617S]